MLGRVVGEDPVRERWLVVRDELDERGRRVWAVVEACSRGRGGIAAVVRATGLSAATVRRGVAEVCSGERALEGRVRRAGAGRPPIGEREPGLREALLGLLDGATRGDSESPLVWTVASPNLAVALCEQGFQVAETTVRRQLQGVGFSLQANRKTHEGSDHPDRDGQFQRIVRVSARALADGEPVIGVDTKKGELIGNYKNAGRELQVTGQPILVNTHDLIARELGKAIPYGVYDVGRDEGWVSGGISADIAAFAVAAVASWWEHLGRERCPTAETLTITADCGDSNGYRTRLWKTELQPWPTTPACGSGSCTIRPAPASGTRSSTGYFSYISINWRAKPLLSRQTVIDLIASTTTSTRLRAYARLDPDTYPTKSLSARSRDPKPARVLGVSPIAVRPARVGPGVDPKSGLIYVRARWYGSVTGQFISVDPLVAEDRSCVQLRGG